MKRMRVVAAIALSAVVACDTSSGPVTPPMMADASGGGSCSNVNRIARTNELYGGKWDCGKRVNVYVTVYGRKVQLTLRDSDEQCLLARLEQLLKRFPAEKEGEPEPPEGWCSKHRVQMKLNHNAKGAWWSHKTAAGWCHGK